MYLVKFSYSQVQIISCKLIYHHCAAFNGRRSVGGKFGGAIGVHLDFGGFGADLSGGFEDNVFRTVECDPLSSRIILLPF